MDGSVIFGLDLHHLRCLCSFLRITCIGLLHFYVLIMLDLHGCVQFSYADTES
jgi:hypothetical protein